MKAKRHDDFTLGKPIPILINCPLYSGLNLNQDKADEAAQYRDSTEPIHLVLQHLRGIVLFELRRGNAVGLKLSQYKQTGTNL
ncbi:hypothetical protein HMPREF2726_11890 [Neisseria sp. HMSC074B07]|nr:hypothetical protein HMPREF2726_11890 [Neisseria sp. HMSC074B07]